MTALHHQPLAAFNWQRSRPTSPRTVLPSCATSLPPASCEDVAALYDEPDGFRSHVHMARHNFGKGEYRYFAYPLPPWLATLAQRSLRATRTGREPMGDAI